MYGRNINKGTKANWPTGNAEISRRPL